MKKKVKKADTDVVEGWMATFADMVTLLMAFFVLLYAMSDPDPGKFEDFGVAMQEAISGEELENEFKELTENLQEIIDKKDLSEKVDIELTAKGIEIQMEGSSLFDDCSADIRSNMEPIIANISNVAFLAGPAGIARIRHFPPQLDSRCWPILFCLNLDFQLVANMFIYACF